MLMARLVDLEEVNGVKIDMVIGLNFRPTLLHTPINLLDFAASTGLRSVRQAQRSLAD